MRNRLPTGLRTCWRNDCEVFLPGMSIVSCAVRQLRKPHPRVSGIPGMGGADGRLHDQQVHSGLEASEAH